MCVCSWDDIWPNVRLSRWASGYAAILQIVMAILILYHFIHARQSDVSIWVSIAVFIILIFMAFLLLVGVLMNHRTVLKGFFILFIFVGIANIIFLILNAFQMIDWREGEEHKCWLAYVLCTAFTGIFAFTLVVTFFYIKYLKDAEPL
ncbi:uncharacterized protein LOC133842349 [Drosophila sulfurigaster albostrigata]|uniref:uncharacterized protein LOC133842349 n=1 Tax=Drosophila sulfurigaster albostrigata TaxID=89887 RepID=UPI002D219F9A|nr:uncharacterized protein LOC133842349 [Drosophila sulfurigaster albostrigata]